MRSILGQALGVVLQPLDLSYPGEFGSAARPQTPGPAATPPAPGPAQAFPGRSLRSAMPA
jgi:hypothetical protein